MSELNDLQVVLTKSKKITVTNTIPFALISDELPSRVANQFKTDMLKTIELYKDYYNGVNFTTEGTNGDYVPSTTKSLLSKAIIDKEARFLFGERPSVELIIKNANTDEEKNQLENAQNFIDAVLANSNFYANLLKAARDCFIGKRIAMMVNYNEQSGVVLSFIPSTRFIYEVSDETGKLSKFVTYNISNDSDSGSTYYYKKKYTDIDGKIYLEETLVDTANNVMEEILPEFLTKLSEIPVRVILNDGLLDDNLGVSEMDFTYEFERDYSKLSNQDIDAERKGMNQIKYAIDMDPTSTEGLAIKPGAFWDLASDSNKEGATGKVGTLETDLSYSAALKQTLARTKALAYEQVDMPDINLETMIGSITSGKALEAIYWGLLSRCKEKMEIWAPAMSDIIGIILRESINYKEVAMMTKNVDVIPEKVDISVKFLFNSPLPGDEAEQKQLDIQEVVAETMSRKSYIKKWRGLTDEEADNEIVQIAREKKMMEEASFSFDGTVGNPEE